MEFVLHFSHQITQRLHIMVALFVIDRERKNHSIVSDVGTVDETPPDCRYYYSVSNKEWLSDSAATHLKALRSKDQ